MLNVSNLSLRFGKRVLFEEVNLKFADGNCYGVIGANGAGKSTFLKILSGEIDATTGHVTLSPGQRMSVLSQDHHKFDNFAVLDTVIMGNSKLWAVKNEKDALYLKEDFTEKDGERASELEGEFAEMDGWNAESDAANMLSELGIKEDYHYYLMSDLGEKEKVRVLLAQALFGNPDLLILDEPTNGLDSDTITWLEDFLLDFKNTVIVVSHDRHFLDTVSTHICDIDFSKIKIYTGNYTFWYESSQLAMKQASDKNKKNEEKKKELLEFIARFSANVAKSKQATSRRKMLDKMDTDEIQPSTRKYPGIIYSQEREAGNEVLSVEGLSASNENGVLFSGIDFHLDKGDKVAFISKMPLAVSTFFQILMGEKKADNGNFKWGVTITHSYLPSDNSSYFESNLNLVDWLWQYTIDPDADETFVRGFLGRMLFSGEESLKKCNVLSGGEKVRCMLSRMMLQNGNCLVLDDPTNHLDLESITSLNNSLKDFAGTVLFASHDREFVSTIATRVIELTPKGVIDRGLTYDEYIQNDEIAKRRIECYS
jgi:ATPase subunit of ABC transporter with duplicated ATPase domains